MSDLIVFRAPRLPSAWTTVRRAICVGVGLLPMLFLATGCSGSAETKNSVSGKVTVKDQPVAGIVTFIYSDKKEMTAPITSDGSYTIPNLKTGSVKVVIKAMPGGAAEPKLVAPPADKGPAMPNMPGSVLVGGGVAPPAMYREEATSPLSYEVKEGKQTYDIALNP